MAKDTDPIKVLNDLIHTSEDGMKGFSEAAEKSDDIKLKMLFKDRASECGTAVQELEMAVETLGGKPDRSGTALGAAHRGWVAAKAAVGNANVAVLEEVERGEDHAKAAYGKALKTTLPPLARAVVEKQYQGVLRNHDRIRDLRNQYRASM